MNIEDSNKEWASCVKKLGLTFLRVRVGKFKESIKTIFIIY